MTNLTKDYKFPGSLHVTSLFIGNQKAKRTSEFFLGFEENQNFELNLSAMVFVPGKIITGFCLSHERNSFPSLVENKFPHLTLMLGQWPAKYSNDVLIALFEKDSQLRSQYESGELRNSSEFYFKTKIIIEGKENVAFISKLKTSSVFKTKSKAFYGR